MAYYLQNEFSKYLKNNNLKSNYKGYITTIYKKILEPEELCVLFDDLEKCLAKDKQKAIGGLNKIYHLICRLYSLLNHPTIGKKSLMFIYTHKMSPRSFRDYGVAIKKYIDFIDSYQNTPDYKKPKGCNTYPVTPWNNACSKLDLLFYDSICVNGMDSLMNRFSSNNDFIQHILENTFFFSKQMAQDRFTKLAEMIRQKIAVPARKSLDSKVQDADIFIDKDLRINILIDSDGNKAVRELVKEETGYTTSSGQDCLFTNFIISHIWGNAFDPRNFTNFWNLAIVPSWANPLLDKTNSADMLTKQLINTFKAICKKHYRMAELDWKSISMECPGCETENVVNGTYKINVINKKQDGKSFGRIQLIELTI